MMMVMTCNAINDIDDAMAGTNRLCGAGTCAEHPFQNAFNTRSSLQSRVHRTARINVQPQRRNRGIQRAIATFRFMPARQ